MSLMSAAEARQVADASPDVPSPRLQIARSARRSEEPDGSRAPAADVPAGPGIQPPAREHVTQRQAALRVRRVRVVREVSIRSQSQPGPVRLTRRGRLVVAGFAILLVAAVVTVLVVAAAGTVQASSHGSAPGSAYRGMREVVVQPGQTLWSIASAAEPSGNLWPVVQQIINVNALSSVNVQAGQLLWVPKG
jgi:hypothetical protein